MIRAIWLYQMEGCICDDDVDSGNGVGEYGKVDLFLGIFFF